MKVLFVEQNEELQAKWVEPLRKKGWGVVRARSLDDAIRMMGLHGEALEAIVVGERFVDFAQKQQLPYVVLTTAWKDNDILRHQNSATPAIAYLSFNQNIDQFCALFDTSHEVEIQLKATGTEGIAAPAKNGKGLELEDYSDILTRPEPTITGVSGLRLESPTIFLGSKDGRPVTRIHEDRVVKDVPTPVKELPEVQEISFAEEETPLPSFSPSPAPVSASVPVPVFQPEIETDLAPVMEIEEHFDRSTQILDSTDLAMSANGMGDLSNMTPDPGEEELITSLDNLDLDALTTKAALSIRSQPDPEPLTDEDEPYTPSPEPTLGMSQLSEATYRMPPPPPTAGYSSFSISQFSVNPAPSGQISDSETLRSYLALREQDVAVLSGQVRSSQEHLHHLETLLKMEKARNTELTHLASKQEQQIKNYDREKQVEFEVVSRQVEDLEQQLKERTEKTRSIELKLRLTVDEINKVKERVRVDIRRIRVREKELEGQLEVLKKDSAALLQARDDKILELKRKVDLLEFNMELVQEQFNKEKQTASDLKMKLKDAAQVVKQVGGLLA